MMNNTLIKQCKLLFLITLLTTIIVPTVLAQSNKTNKQSLDTKTTPIIIAERGYYQSNDIAQIYGMNFLSYERIRLNVRYLDNSLRQEILLDSFDVFADLRGNMSAEWKVYDLQQIDTEFIVEATGTMSGITTKTQFSTTPFAGESVDIFQCANSNVDPQNLDCPNGGPTGWVSGIVGNSKARHFEGDSIAYRNVMAGLNVGKVYKWTVKYETSISGLNAIDYLTTYNQTITNANPCQDGATVNGFCTFASPTSTLAIPTDISVTIGRDQTASTLDDIVQTAGSITAWGATITAVSVPTYTGTFPTGTSEASVDIIFTANSATAVIAWGGHISSRTDWGQAFGSVNITGAPYHTSNGGLMNITDTTTCCGGSQDLQLQAAAVTASARIVIIKHATPPSSTAFNFSTVNLNPSTFILTDNSSMTDPRQVFDNINTFNLKTITETSNGAYDLISIVCTVDVGTGGTPTPIRTGDSIAIDIRSGDVVTCTFNNDFITASAVSVSGKVVDPGGNALAYANVSITDQNGLTRSVMTNHFGNFSFRNVDAGADYFFNIRHRVYVYPTRLISVSEELKGLVFYPE